MNDWARTRAAELRITAAQAGALEDLPVSASPAVAAVTAALGEPDAAELLEPLGRIRAHLDARHEGLVARIDRLGEQAEAVRAGSRARRGR